jgi:hypothetical protein
MAEITFIISPTGTIHIEVDGVVGAACEDLTRAYENALGTRVSLQEKPAYYEELDHIEQKIYE